MAIVFELEDYGHPGSHPPSIITQDADNRFVTDAQIADWDSKATTAEAQAAIAADVAQVAADAAQVASDKVDVAADVVAAEAARDTAEQHSINAAASKTTASIKAADAHTAKVAAEAAQAAAEQAAEDALLIGVPNGSISTIKIADDAVDKDKINADVAGNGLSQNVDGSLEVNVDGTSIQIVGGILEVIPEASTIDNYTAGDTYGALDMGETGSTASSWSKALEYIVPTSGTIRTKLWVTGDNVEGFAKTGYARIYKNGVAVGTIRSKSNSGYSNVFSEDIAVSAGDKIQVYSYINAGVSHSVRFCARSGVATIPGTLVGVFGTFS